MGRTVSRTELEAGAGQGGGGDDFFSIFPGPDFVVCWKSRPRLVSSCTLNYFQSNSFTNVLTFKCQLKLQYCTGSGQEGPG